MAIRLKPHEFAVVLKTLRAEAMELRGCLKGINPEGVDESDQRLLKEVEVLERVVAALQGKPISEARQTEPEVKSTQMRLWLKFWLPLGMEEDEQEPCARLTVREAKQLRDHLNELLSPDELPKLTRQAEPAEVKS